MCILFESQKQIINCVKKSNESKKLIPEYLANFLRKHIQGYKDVHILKKIHKILNEKFNKI